MSAVQIRSRTVGPGHPCWIIAEIGVNHQGDPDLAARLIDEAAGGGADAVKLQKRDPASLLTLEAREAPYVKPGSFGPTYGSHRAALELPESAWSDLFRYAVSLGLTFFASPWDRPSAEFLIGLRMEVLKVASACLTDLQLVDVMAQARVPLIVSTGMAGLPDIEAAVETITRHHDQIVLLHCVSQYPAENHDLNLRCLQTLREWFGYPVGWSGHERGLAPSIAAVALGANVIERHVTLDRTMVGPDHAASLEPQGFARLVRDIRNVEAALGSPDKRLLPCEEAARARLAKSVVARRAIQAGEVLTDEVLGAKSPGTGISPRHRAALLGRVAARAVPEDTVLPPDALSWPHQEAA